MIVVLVILSVKRSYHNASLNDEKLTSVVYGLLASTGTKRIAPKYKIVGCLFLLCNLINRD